jgi:hypothetical protein
MTRPAHPPRLDYSNYTWRRVQITKILVIQCSPFSPYKNQQQSAQPTTEDNSKIRCHISKYFLISWMGLKWCQFPSVSPKVTSFANMQTTHFQHPLGKLTHPTPGAVHLEALLYTTGQARYRGHIYKRNKVRCVWNMKCPIRKRRITKRMARCNIMILRRAHSTVELT